MKKTRRSRRLILQLDEDRLEGLISQILRQVFERFFKGNDRACLSYDLLRFVLGKIKPEVAIPPQFLEGAYASRTSCAVHS
jgi:hypothetical protein